MHDARATARDPRRLRVWARRAWRALAPVLAAAAIAGVAWAQSNTLRIAAVVDDDIITEFDVALRLQLVVRSTGLPDNQDTTQRLAPQILRQLIDERIQAQEAERLGVEVLDDELARALADIEAQNNIPEGRLREVVVGAGISYDAFLERVTAELKWAKLQARRLRPGIEISSDEIDEVLQRITANQGETEFRVAEIFLPVDAPEQENEVQQTALRLIDELRSGEASFAALARQFSQNATAAVGGDLGWIFAGQLDPEIDRALIGMQVGEISEPVRTAAGYYVIGLVERRATAAPSAEDMTLVYREIALPLPAELDLADRRSQIELAETISETAVNCADLAQLSEELGLGPAPPPMRAQVADLTAPQSALLQALSVDQASPPQTGDGEVSVFMVCERTLPASALPAREDVEQNLVREKLDLLAQRYLRDLRAAAFIDVRV